MKTLIIIAGLTGVGKSYIAKKIKTEIKNSYYFDSDLFAKNYMKKKQTYF